MRNYDSAKSRSFLLLFFKKEVLALNLQIYACLAYLHAVRFQIR